MIRFGSIDSDRIGSFAASIELYLCKKELSQHKHWDFFYYNGPVCNKFLAKKWEKLIRIHWIFKYLDKINRLFPGWGNRIIHEIMTDRDTDRVYLKTNPQIKFTEKENMEGFIKSCDLGIFKKYICFHVRDSAYLNKIYPGKDWGYHDYRDASIKNIMPAIEYLASKGYQCIRMGSIVKNKLPINNHMIIDYSTSSIQSDFMDVYLMSQCNWFIGNTAGIFALADIFRKPILYLNYVPQSLIHDWNPKSMTILKYIWSNRLRRSLTLEELKEDRIGTFVRSEDYSDRGLQVIENSPEEILEAVKIMEEQCTKES